MEREYSEQEREFQTPSIYLSGALIIKGFKFRVIKQNSKVLFSFLHSSDLEKSITQYHEGSLLLPANQYATILLNLKSIIYSSMNAMNNKDS